MGSVSRNKTSSTGLVKSAEMLPVFALEPVTKLNSMLESPALMITQGGEQQGRGKSLESKVNYHQQKKKAAFLYY